MRWVAFTFLTGLAAASGAHAQELSLTGTASGGIVYDSDADREFRFHDEVNFVFTGAGQADNGLAFGAILDIDETSDVEAEVFLSGAFGTLAFGDLDPATDRFGIRDLGFSGLGIDDVAEQYRNAGAGADVSWSYTAGGLSFVASAEIGDAQSVAVAAEYAAGPFSMGLGYVDDTDDGTSAVSVAAGYSFGAVAVSGLYSDWSEGGQGYGVDLSVETGAATVTAAWAQARGAEADPEQGLGDAYGVGVEVPLSGGLTVSGGVGLIETDAVPDGSRTVADFGVTMSF